MDIFSEPRLDLVHSLPREAFAEIILILRGALPPPVSDDPADWARRDRAAMAVVASLQPANAAEGRLAAQFVAADAWALDCLRLAGERRLELEIARKCRAQAMSMMREGKSALRLLLRLQAGRRVAEKDEAASDRAAWAEHSAVGMMEEALTVAPARPVTPDARDGRKSSSPGTAAVGNRAEAVPNDVWEFRQRSNQMINPRDTNHETDMGFADAGRCRA